MAKKTTKNQNINLSTNRSNTKPAQETKLIAAPIEQKLITGGEDLKISSLTGADPAVPANDWSPAKVYENADTQRMEITKENKGKSAVYCWKNKLNGKLYVGSAKDLTRRLYHYYSQKHLEIVLGKGKMSYM